MPNLLKPGAGQWMPDADPIAAPEGALLRADNLVDDTAGGQILRKGSDLVYAGAFQDLVVRSLYSVRLDGTVRRLLGADDRLYIDGVADAEFDGSGDFAMGDDAYQAFIARGTTKKAYDGSTVRDWGVPTPFAAPTTAAVDAITDDVAEFNNTESPAVSAPEGTDAFTTDDTGAANEAIQLTPDSGTNRGSLQRLWTSDQDFFDIKGTQGTDNDQFDLLLSLAEPRNVEKIIIQFGVGDSSTVPFDKDRYEYTVDLEKGELPSIKDVTSSGYAAYESAVLALLQAIDPTVDVGTIRTPEEVKQTMEDVGSQPSPRSGGRPDPGTWSHITITRGSFTRVGATSGRDWSTVRGFRITYVARKGTTSTATFAKALWSGGGDLSLTGKFRACFRAGRDMGQYIELGPPSPASDPISLNHQTLQITVSAAQLSALEGQADQLWIYLFGGLNLNTWYRFAVTGVVTSTGIKIDEISAPAGSLAGSTDAVKARRTRLTSWGLSIPGVTSTTDLVVTLRKSEEQALSEGIRLEPYQIAPPDNIVGIAGPWAGRMYLLTSDGSVYPTSNLSPSACNSRQRLDLTRYGEPYWIVRTTGGIYVGMSEDVVYLEGSADDSADLTYIDLYPRAMGVGNPPVDAAVVAEGNTILYRSKDGLISFTGGAVAPVPFGETELLWRGRDRHGVQALNVTSGRFRMAFDNNVLYMLAPEGTETSGNVVYRMKAGMWRRLVYDQIGEIHSIIAGPTGELLAGDAAGQLWLLETGTQDDGNDISVVLWTPASSGGDPLSLKDPSDLQLHVDSGGDQGTVAVHKDASETASGSYTFSTTSPTNFRIQADDVGEFVRAQLRITGSFDTFVLSAWNLAYLKRAQRRVVLDTGWFSRENPGDMLWLRDAVEIDCISAADLTLELYKNDLDTLFTSQTVVVTARKRDVWRTTIPRGCKATRIRLIFRTTAANGDTGFDAESVRVHARPTGNQGGSEPLVVWSAGAV